MPQAPLVVVPVSGCGCRIVWYTVRVVESGDGRKRQRLVHDLRIYTKTPLRYTNSNSKFEYSSYAWFQW